MSQEKDHADILVTDEMVRAAIDVWEPYPCSAAHHLMRRALEAALHVQGIPYRHILRGSEYRALGEAEIQTSRPIIEGDSVVVYRAAPGRLWARLRKEFHDGRFAPLP